MADNKTQPHDGDVLAFLNSVEHEQRREDGLAMLQIMREVTGLEPKMWGDTLVGFGIYHYRYLSGREGSYFLTGFSPRKQNLTVYIMAGFDQYDDLMGKLGKFTIGKSCLYIKKLGDIDQDVLRELIRLSLEYMHKTYPD
jgi:hypothetical protein